MLLRRRRLSELKQVEVKPVTSFDENADVKVGAKKESKVSKKK